MDIRFELIVRTNIGNDYFKGKYYAKSEGEALEIYDRVRASYSSESNWMLVCKDYDCTKKNNILWSRIL